MELLKINKTLDEQRPLLVSACMSLKGYSVHPKQVDSLFESDDFSGLTLVMVDDIMSYNNAINFLAGCKEQKYLHLTGSLAMAMASFLLRRVSVKDGYTRPYASQALLEAELNGIFVHKQGISFHVFLKQVVRGLDRLQFMTHDNEAFIYLVVTYYLNNYCDSVVVYSDLSTDRTLRYLDLKQWVLAWEG